MRRRIHASDLARLGWCEKKVVLDLRHGEQITARQAAARERGKKEHERFDREVVAHHRPDPRCFVASALYGPADPRTDVLRGWRDRVLDTTRLGRLAIRAYYRVSPWLVRRMSDYPALMPPVRWLVDRVVLAIKEDHQCDTPRSRSTSTR